MTRDGSCDRNKLERAAMSRAAARLRGCARDRRVDSASTAAESARVGGRFGADGMGRANLDAGDPFTNWG